MDIEEKLFRRKRMIPEKLLSFGFGKTEGGYAYTKDILNGDFRAHITVTEEGKVSGKLIDMMNSEEYAPLRNENFTGGYVGTVRGAYTGLLENIASSCFCDVLFASDQANRITSMILADYSVLPDFPWGEGRYQGYGTFRHPGNRKWFALIMNVRWDVLLKNKSTNTVDIINLKIDPAQGERLCSLEGIYPAYHMNHRHWISVTLNDTLDDGSVMELVEKSYEITK